MYQIDFVILLEVNALNIFVIMHMCAFDFLILNFRGFVDDYLQSSFIEQNERLSSE